MASQNSIVENFISKQNTSGAHSSGGFSGITLGVVIDTDDPLQMGRLKIFCGTLNDDPKQLPYVPWAVYGSPFAGNVNNDSYTRGSGESKPESSGGLHYGFWGIPELGAHVLVACIDGDYRRRVWIGCVPQHQETSTLHGGKWKWDNGAINGPLTSTDEPMEPLYTNANIAFTEERNSPEWKSRIADYQSTAIRDDSGQVPNSRKLNYQDQTNSTMRSNEPDTWVHDAIGSHGYDWTGFKNMGAMLSSRTYGFSSPGMHMLVFDDRAFNDRIKIRTTSGHQILLDDTNERIYIATNKGNNWIEFDSDGNIDLFSKSRISINGDADINISAGKSIRMFAGDSINMYAGHMELDDSTPIVVTDVPSQGTITMQAESDFSVISKNSRLFAAENQFIETGLNYYASIGDSSIVTVSRDINTSTINGDLITSSGNCIYSTSKSTTKYYSEGSISLSSDGDSEMLSFNGTASMSAKDSVRLKSADKNIDIEASSSGGSGTVNIFSKDSQLTVSPKGISSVSTKNITSVSANEVVSAVQPGFALDNKNALDTILASVDINISKLTKTDISVNAALGKLIHKTAQRGHSYDVLGDQIDTLSKNLDILTVQTGLMFSGVQTAIGILGGSVSLNFAFDIACALEQIYKFLPQGLLDAFATFQELKQAAAAIGQQIDDLTDLANSLSDINFLNALGLPSLNIGLSFGSSSCTEKMPLFKPSITYDVPQLEIPAKLRKLVGDIYEANSEAGSPPPPKVIDWIKNYI